MVLETTGDKSSRDKWLGNVRTDLLCPNRSDGVCGSAASAACISVLGCTGKRDLEGIEASPSISFACDMVGCKGTGG